MQIAVITLRPHLNCMLLLGENQTLEIADLPMGQDYTPLPGRKQCCYTASSLSHLKMSSCIHNEFHFTTTRNSTQYLLAGGTYREPGAGNSHLPTGK